MRRAVGTILPHGVKVIIEGPLRISTETSEESSGFSLQFSFTEEFQKLELAEQVKEFASYLKKLQDASASLEASDPNQQGLLIVLQVGEQLLPLIEEGELPLSETLEVEVEQEFTIPGWLANPSDQLN